MVTGVRFSPDGKQVATSSYDGTIKIWDAADSDTAAARRRVRRPKFSSATRPRRPSTIDRFGREVGVRGAISVG